MASLNQDRTLSSSEAALKEPFLDMFQNGATKKIGGCVKYMENIEERCDGKYIYLKKNTKNCVYTVGELKQFLNEAKVPDNAKLAMVYEDFAHCGIGSICYAKNENELTINDE